VLGDKGVPTSLEFEILDTTQLRIFEGLSKTNLQKITLQQLSACIFPRIILWISPLIT
jgi:hypothetical protein